MQFITKGPDVPERLIQAHEDGRVVFFCGAGISYPAGLPGFGELVQKIFKELLEEFDETEKTAFKAGRFDTVINLLESRIVGGRKTVREALAEILTPDDLSKQNATATHAALLTLGKNSEGRTRLITTNFDRIFEKVIEDKNLSVERFSAPLLPVPKKRWDGLVYLHGLLTETPTPNDLDRLVLSSGDFGLAYLTERWASRFVSELFRNCIVCFVGYSINDPVLRYMTDAISADRQLGETLPEMFAFGSYSKGKEKEYADEWKAKSVTPIFYKEHCNHLYLHKTLRAWAEIYRDGIRGKERFVVQNVISHPRNSTKEENFVGRVLWALSDSTGLLAKRFARLDPVPSLDWLEPLSEKRYVHADLIRFGVTPKPAQDDKITFSHACRPSPYNEAPLMALVYYDKAPGTRWDNVMDQLARWLVRHLNDPALLLWLVVRGGQLHEELAVMIANKLDELAGLERKADTDELDRIRDNAPNATPDPNMRTLWRLLLSGTVRSGKIMDARRNLYPWSDRLKLYGLTTTLRLELRELLTPRVSLREPYSRAKDHEKRNAPQRMRDLVEAEVVLSTDYAHSSLPSLKDAPGWTEALPVLLPDFNLLLRDALDLKRELDQANDKSDLSYTEQPSISPHEQNNDFYDWTVLIELTRDAWLATLEKTPEQARFVAESWWFVPYPLFRRLAFFAATHEAAIPARQALEWLLRDDHWWLWSIETQREAIRLLVTIAPKMDQADRDRLVQAILIGPPRAMFRDDIKAEDWDQLGEREIWLQLAKIAQAGATLNRAGQDRLDELSAKYPKWALAADEKDEFPYWVGGGDGDEGRTFVAAPRRRRELVKWLKKPPSQDPRQEDDWRKRCREDFATTACALSTLAHENIWPKDRWRKALQAWSTEHLTKLAWRRMAPVVAGIPDKVLPELVHEISQWLQNITKTSNGHDDLFFALAKRILALDHQDGADTDDPVGRALNHPVGHVTQALLNWWYQKRKLEDNQGLPDEVKPILTELCDTQRDKFRHGRVLLAAHVVTLFRVDRDWTEDHLLPLFDWKIPEVEARAVWKGFLWSPRLYGPLMEVIKREFLDTAIHYSSLGEYDKQYASILTFSALDPGDIFTHAELRLATKTLPPKGLEAAAQALVRTLESVDDQRADYWANRVQPYLKFIWPNMRDCTSPKIADSFARLCVAAKDAFSEALDMLRVWLQPLEFPDTIVHLLDNSGLSQKSPKEALDFLNLIISDQQQWSPRELGDCLKAIKEAVPALENDERYRRLSNLTEDL